MKFCTLSAYDLNHKKYLALLTESHCFKHAYLLWQTIISLCSNLNEKSHLTRQQNSRQKEMRFTLS